MESSRGKENRTGEEREEGRGYDWVESSRGGKDRTGEEKERQGRGIGVSREQQVRRGYERTDRREGKGRS